MRYKQFYYNNFFRVIVMRRTHRTMISLIPMTKNCYPFLIMPQVAPFPKISTAVEVQVTAKTAVGQGLQNQPQWR